DLARAVEARGFESLWFPEHTHIPVSRRSPWPGGPTLPKEYWHTHDPFVALATAAAVTTTLKVGSGICLLVERDPITTAKEVASLDFLSRGRVLFGVGGGWNAEEMEDHGTDFRRGWRASGTSASRARSSRSPRRRPTRCCPSSTALPGSRASSLSGAMDLRLAGRRALVTGSSAGIDVDGGWVESIV